MDSLFSDVDSLNESWSSEDQDDINSLFGGQARSIFSSLEDTITKIDDFLLFERGFMPNDVVHMVSEPLGQTGKVVNVDLMVDLENIFGHKVQNVNSKNLQKIRLMSVGDFVVRGAWAGKVDKIIDRLTILFDDGSNIQITAAGPGNIIATSPDVIEDPQYPYYPGQRIQTESSSVETRWFCGMRKGRYDHGTVLSVEAGLVYVDWLSCAVNTGKTGSPPAALQDAKDLFLLSSLTNANWQLGDWCVLSGTHSSSFQEIAVIAKTKTKIDVQWQDGSQSTGLDSQLLYPVNVVDAHDFWPDTFVVEKGTADDSHGDFERWGVVRSVDSKERTVKVKWYKSISDGLDLKDGTTEETVSAYELVEHPEFSYSLGEAVIRTGKLVADLTKEAELKTVEFGEDQAEHPSDYYLSLFGIVAGLKCGKIEVQWATGTISEVAPTEIRRVDNGEGAIATIVLPNETVQQSQEDCLVRENHQVQDVLGDNSGHTRDSSSSLSEIAIGMFTSITSSLFGSLSTSLTGVYKIASEDVEVPDNSLNEEELELCNSELDDQVAVGDDSDIPMEKTSEQIEEANMNIVPPSARKHLDSFKQFDMVSDCSDHHFVDGTGMQSTQVKTGWLKKVHREWGILEKDLPEGIYVRVYEERMDLLRAGIRGAANTPYHGNLFFFDICLPQQYPNEPPMVYYHSGGLRVNPNLYESGKVCLSLLNTWTGSGSEVWNPESSTVLQVLLSLQALVLNERPYFNEAGYDAQIGKAEGEKNSVSYNENTFLVSCRSMLYLLRKPPKHFEGLVDEHFSHNGRDFLLACNAYMEGAPIGYPFNWENANHENADVSSAGFKIMLGKLIPRLVEAFSDKGIDCNNLFDRLP